MAEWKEGVIQTGVDKLMKYLRKEREVRVDEAAASLDVDRETVMTWAKSLQKSGLIELRYTARRGRVLRVVDDTKESEKVMKGVKKDVSKSVETLADLAREKARLERFEEVVERLEAHMIQDEAAAEKLQEDSDIAESVDELEQYLEDLESVEDDVTELKEHIDNLKQDMDVLSQLDSLKEPEQEGTGESSGAVEKPKKPEKPGSSRSPLAVLKSLLPFGKKTDKNLVCEVCGKEFDTAQGLNTHMNLIHQGTSNNESAENSGSVSDTDKDSGEESGNEDGETFKCRECDKEFGSLRGVQTHMGMAHDEKFRNKEESL